MLTTVLSLIVVLGVLVFVHEAGHFVAAKWAGIYVHRFSLGLGSPIPWLTFRRGETEYSISWLPLGGYVKMAGMEEMEVIEGKDERRRVAGDLVDVGVVDAPVRTPEGRDFESKSVAARALVISAGVLMNLIFAALIFMVGAAAWGVDPPETARLARPNPVELPPAAQALATVPMGALVMSVDGEPVKNWDDFVRKLATARPGATVIRFTDAPPITIHLTSGDTDRKLLLHALQPVQPPVVGAMVEKSAAQKAGMRPGDRIVAAGGTPVRYWQDVVQTVQGRAGQRLPVLVQRGTAQVTLLTTPAPVPDTLLTAKGKLIRTVGRLGIVPRLPDPVRLGPGQAVVYGFRETGHVVSLVVGVLRDLVTGRQSPRSLGGPILIGQLSGQVARAGLESFLRFMAFLSINLAVFNLLPVPVLDGGHLVFIGIEAVRGRALTVKQRARLMQVGFVLIVALMVWAVANDVMRLFGV